MASSVSAEDSTFSAAEAWASSSGGVTMMSADPLAFTGKPSMSHSASTTIRYSPAIGNSAPSGPRSRVSEFWTVPPLSSVSTWSVSAHCTSGQKVRAVPEGSITVPCTLPDFRLRLLGAGRGWPVWLDIFTSTRTGAPIGTVSSSGDTAKSSPSTSAAMSSGLIGAVP